MRTGRIYPDAIVRPLRRPWLVLATAVAVVALPTIASGALSAPAAPAANTQTFQDSVGEDPGAPDITTITVSNDDAATITFRINIPNRAQYSPGHRRRHVPRQRRKPGDGRPRELRRRLRHPAHPGRDRALQVGRESDYTLSATQSSLNYSWSSGPTIRINASDLSNTRQLNFDVAGSVRDRVRSDNWRVRLHELLMAISRRRSASTRTHSRSRSRRSS